MLEIGRYRADPHRSGVKGGDRTIPRVSAEPGMNATDAPAAISRRGLLLVLSFPSGAGKTTITRLLLERDPTVSLSVSATTRPLRPGEIDGRDYIFIEQAQFARMV